MASTIFSAILIFRIYPVPKTAPSLDLLAAILRPAVRPEPAEGFVYLVLCLLIPIFAILICLPKIKNSWDVHKIWGVVLPVTVATLMFFLFVSGDLVAIIWGKFRPNEINSFRETAKTVYVSIFIGAVLSVALTKVNSDVRMRRVIYLLLGILTLIQFLSWRVITSNFNDNDIQWMMHADPVFYVIAQVAAGKSILVDLPSQYGLFPELLNIVLFPFSLSSTLVGNIFGVMELISVGVVLWIAASNIKSSVILLLTGAALVMVTFENVLHFAGYREIYFQYWPIRFFWPAVSLIAFQSFCKQPTLTRCVCFSVLGAIATIWNADTGLVITVAFGAFLFAKLIFSPQKRNAAAFIGVHVFVSVCLLVMALGLLALKGGSLHLSWLYEYQQIFVKLGLMMLPLPRNAHGWMAVTAVYGLGLLFAISSWKFANHARGDMVFYLSMLGIGLFGYYAGRSHVLNLVKVMWPSVLIAGVLSDVVLQSVRRRDLGQVYLWLPGAGIASLFLIGGSYFYHLPRSISEVRTHAILRSENAPSIVRSEIELIKRHAPRGASCAIVSLRQGVYHLETGTSSSIHGPGIIELLMKSDEDHFIEQVEGGKLECLVVGVSPFSRANLPINIELLETVYAVTDKTPTGSMIFLARR